MRPWRRLLLATTAGALAAVVPAAAAHAHPLGNLTVNGALEVVVRPERIDATYVVDLAELPTVQARQQFDGAGGPDAWAAQRCARLAAGVTIDGVAPAATGAPTLTFPPGQGGLDTLRLECALRLDRAATSRTFDVVDTNDADRIGWREIVVRGDGVRLAASDVPATSPSALLTAYPTGGTPTRIVRAHVTTAGVLAAASPSSAAATATPATTRIPQARGADSLTRRMNALVAGHRLTAPLAALALLLAVVLGALHALAPGHGKTLMAATVVARRGAARQVLTIGATVAATHTTGVLVLGLAIWTSQAVAPDRVLPWLTLASGALLVATGVGLAVNRIRRGSAGPGFHRHGAFGHGHDHPHAAVAADAHAHGDHGDAPGHDRGAHDHGSHDHRARGDHGPHEHGHGHAEHPHDHPHPHDHAHDDQGHDHPHPHERGLRMPAADAPLSRRWLVAMGFAGGMVPTPSALVVLLGAAALGRTWLGVVLVAVYGVGMAATLVIAGVALVRLQGWLELHWYGSRGLSLAMRVAPLVTASALTIGGVTLAVRAFPMR